MQWRNNNDGYGWTSIGLHWFAVAALVTMFWIGVAAWTAGEAGDRDGRRALMAIHIGVGALVALPLLLRVVSHYLQPQPAPPKQHPALMFLAAATHHLLLLAILLLIVSGPLAVWSGGRDISVFGAFAIPTPFATENEPIHEGAELVHAIGRLLLIVAVPLHILGAAKHLFMDDDGVFQRMLGPPQDRT